LRFCRVHLRFLERREQGKQKTYQHCGSDNIPLAENNGQVMQKINRLFVLARLPFGTAGGVLVLQQFITAFSPGHIKRGAGFLP